MTQFLSAHSDKPPRQFQPQVIHGLFLGLFGTAFRQVKVYRRADQRMFLAIGEAIAVQQIGLLPLGQPFQTIVQFPAQFLFLHNGLRLHGVGVGYGFDAPQLFLSRQNIVQRNALAADTVLILRHHPLLKSSKGIPNHIHHGVTDSRSRIGQELHAARRIELRHGFPQAHIPCLFQIVRVKVQARLCQIHAAEKVICHLANKGLVVVDQAVQRGSIAFLCQRTKPFIRLLHGRFPALRQTNERLCALAQKGDAAALDSLIENNKSFIGKVANDLFRSMNLAQSGLNLDTDDLKQAGNLGLWKAVPKFDAARGMKFLTYAAPAIRNAMMDMVRDAFAAFEQRMVTEDKDGVCYQRVSLDDVLPGEEQLRRIEAIADPYAMQPQSIMEEQESRRELYYGLKRLTQREQTYLLYRYGFTDGEEHPLIGTAIYFHLTKGRAKKTEEQAMDNLWLELPWWFD